MWGNIDRSCVRYRFSAAPEDAADAQQTTAATGCCDNGTYVSAIGSQDCTCATQTTTTSTITTGGPPPTAMDLWIQSGTGRLLALGVFRISGLKLRMFGVDQVNNRVSFLQDWLHCNSPRITTGLDVFGRFFSQALVSSIAASLKPFVDSVESTLGALIKFQSKFDIVTDSSNKVNLLVQLFDKDEWLSVKWTEAKRLYEMLLIEYVFIERCIRNFQLVSLAFTEAALWCYHMDDVAARLFIRQRQEAMDFRGCLDRLLSFVKTNTVHKIQTVRHRVLKRFSLSKTIEADRISRETAEACAAARTRFGNRFVRTVPKLLLATVFVSKDVRDWFAKFLDVTVITYMANHSKLGEALVKKNDSLQAKFKLANILIKELKEGDKYRQLSETGCPVLIKTRQALGVFIAETSRDYLECWTRLLMVVKMRLALTGNCKSEEMDQHRPGTLTGLTSVILQKIANFWFVEPHWFYTTKERAEYIGPPIVLA